MGVVHQRVEAGFAIAGTHGHQRHFAGERHEAFQQARHAAQLGEGAYHVFRRAQYLLALTVVTQGAGFQYGRQADAGHCGVQVCLREDVGEGRGRDTQVAEHAFSNRRSRAMRSASALG